MLCFLLSQQKLKSSKSLFISSKSTWQIILYLGLSSLSPSRLSQTMWELFIKSIHNSPCYKARGQILALITLDLTAVACGTGSHMPLHSNMFPWLHSHHPRLVPAIWEVAPLVLPPSVPLLSLTIQQCHLNSEEAHCYWQPRPPSLHSAYLHPMYLLAQALKSSQTQHIQTQLLIWLPHLLLPVFPFFINDYSCCKQKNPCYHLYFSLTPTSNLPAKPVRSPFKKDPEPNHFSLPPLFPLVQAAMTALLDHCPGL